MLDNLSRGELKDLAEKLMWNDQLGCFTRQAFEHILWREIQAEAQWIVFFDVDEMKNLNDRLGYAGTSALIKRANTNVRSSDFVIGQKLSGDEFIMVLTRNHGHESSHPEALCKRIQQNLKKGGASATFAYRRVTSSDLEENLADIVSAVMRAKQENRKGSIIFVEA